MKRRVRALVAVLAAVAATAGCGGVNPDEKIVKDFFRASRMRDNATLGTFATATFDPRTAGQVQSLKLLNVSEERPTPLPIRKYTQALDEAKAAQETFSKEKLEYQKQNIRAIERVVAAEGKNAPVPRQDAAVQVTWTKWRDDQGKYSKAVSDAQRRLSAVKGLAELSLSQPTGPTPDVTQMDGRMVEKDVTVEAEIRTPDGQTVTKTLVVTLERAVLADGTGGAEQLGRWIVTRVREAQAPAATS
jgi:hypothetical protein